MKVGIISDTHDNLNAIKKAVELFKGENIELLIHAGDFIAPFTLPFYKELESLDPGCKFIGVFGNNDGDVLLLHKRSEGKIHPAPHVFDFGGKKFIVTHYPDAVSALAAGDGVDVVVFGHTHEASISKAGQTLIINPGECGGWSGGLSTVALLETKSMKARIVELL